MFAVHTQAVFALSLYCSYMFALLAADAYARGVYGYCDFSCSSEINKTIQKSVKETNDIAKTILIEAGSSKLPKSVKY